MRLPAAVLLALLVPLLVACGGGGGGGDGGDGGAGGGGGDGLRLGGAPVELEVTVQDWTGWQREQPEPETRSVTVGLGDSFTVDTVVDDVTVTVLSLSRDEIELGTSSDLAPESGLGGADHNRLRSTFDLRRDGAVEFSTPTLDAGTTVRIAAVG